MAWIAQSGRVTRIVCATLKQRDNVIPFRGKTAYPFLLAANTERVALEQLSSCLLERSSP